MQITPISNNGIVSKGTELVKKQVNNCFNSNPLSDEFVINTLKEELSTQMEQQEIQKWLNQVVLICKNLGISITKLPINKDLPGSLTKEESHKFVTALFSKVL